MTTATEIQKIALDVFENKLDYKDNDFICVMNILKESYMKAKGMVNNYDNEKVVDTEGADAEGAVDSDAEGADDNYFLRTHRYTNYDSDADSDSSSYTGSYLSPY
tara:strand:+ start:1727 stop:2041 length:315 start_codon:yes stop_codon:yes gene_type:complete